MPDTLGDPTKVFFKIRVRTRPVTNQCFVRSTVLNSRSGRDATAIAYARPSKIFHSPTVVNFSVDKTTYLAFLCRFSALFTGHR